MKNLQVPDVNTFDEKRKAFFSSKLYHQLAQKYTPKPYEERNKGKYLFAHSLSFVCHIVAITTAATFVFSYLYAILRDFPHAAAAAAAITAVALVLVEVAQRLLVPDYISDFFQYGKYQPVQLAAILSLSALSVFLSWRGGFDFVQAVKSEPAPAVPALYDIPAVKTDYDKQIATARIDAENWKSARSWRGRLSTADGKAYDEKLTAVQELRKAKAGKVSEYEGLNRKLIADAKAEYATELSRHQNKVLRRGSGLAWVSVLFQLLFFLSVWYVERYQYKTAIQYAAAVGEVQPVAEKLFSNTVLKTAPIGFRPPSENALPKTEKTLFKQSVAGSKAYVFADSKTVEHVSGSGTVKHYTLAQIENMISTYQKRERSAKSDKAKENNGKWIKYWNDKKAELLESYY